MIASDPFAAKRAAMREEFFGRFFLLGGWLGGTDTYKRTMWAAVPDIALARARLGQPLAHHERISGACHGDVGHGGPHCALVSVSAAEPAAQEKEAGEEVVAHGRTLGGEGIGCSHGSFSSPGSAWGRTVRQALPAGHA